MKIELTGPTRLNEIPLINYQKFYASQQASNDDEFIMQKMVQCFCGIELKDVAKIRMTDVVDIVTNLTKTLEEKPKFEPTFKIDNIEFGFVPNIENISFGEYVDAEEYWDNVEDLHKGMAVLFRPISEKKGDKYQIYEYKGSSEFSDAMRYAPMSVVISTRLFFLDYRNRLIDGYSGLFGEGNGDEGAGDLSERTQFGKRWGWYGSLHRLAQGDVTKFDEVTRLSHRKCLTFLTFTKQSDDLQAREFERAKRTR